MSPTIEIPKRSLELHPLQKRLFEGDTKTLKNIHAALESESHFSQRIFELMQKLSDEKNDKNIISQLVALTELAIYLKEKTEIDDWEQLKNVILDWINKLVTETEEGDLDDGTSVLYNGAMTIIEPVFKRLTADERVILRNTLVKSIKDDNTPRILQRRIAELLNLFGVDVETCEQIISEIESFRNTRMTIKVIRAQIEAITRSES